MESTYSEAFDNEYSNYRPPRSAARDNQPDGKMEAMANTAARAESMTDQLLHQWALDEVDETVRNVGNHLISYIDDSG